jgi:hypothetical protein
VLRTEALEEGAGLGEREAGSGKAEVRLALGAGGWGMPPTRSGWRGIGSGEVTCLDAPFGREKRGGSGAGLGSGGGGVAGSSSGCEMRWPLESQTSEAGKRFGEVEGALCGEGEW